MVKPGNVLGGYPMWVPNIPSVGTQQWGLHDNCGDECHRCEKF